MLTYQQEIRWDILGPGATYHKCHHVTMLRGDFVMLERDRRYVSTVGTCRAILTRRRFVSQLVLLDESMISYAWMANKNGAGGSMTGTSVRVAF